MGPGARSALVTLGAVATVGGLGYLGYRAYESSRPQSDVPSPSSGSGSGSGTTAATFTVLGFEPIAPGSAASSATLGLQAVGVMLGDRVAGYFTLQSSSAQNYGVRAWVVLPTSFQSSSTAYLSGAYQREVEGHLFPSRVSAPSSSSPQTATYNLAAGQSVTDYMISGQLSGGLAYNLNSLTRLDVLWAWGPASVVTSLPNDGGTLPQNGINGVQYVYSTGAIRMASGVNLVA